MMALPFAVFALALVLAWRRQVGSTTLVWAAGMVLLLVLFKLHATDALQLDF